MAKEASRRKDLNFCNTTTTTLIGEIEGHQDSGGGILERHFDFIYMVAHNRDGCFGCSCLNWFRLLNYQYEFF